MNSRNILMVRGGFVLLCLGALLSFQNCSKATFITPPQNQTATVSASNSASNDSGSGLVNPDAQKIKVSADGGSVFTAEQKIFFHNEIGSNLKVSLDHFVSDKVAVVLVQNGDAGRKAFIRLERKSNGFVFASYEDPNKPYLCLDPQQSVGAMINGSINCSSALLISGTRQLGIKLGNSYKPLLDNETIIGVLAANRTCPAESCIRISSGIMGLVVTDLVDSANGMKIVSQFTMSDGRIKVILNDSEGRSLTMLVTDPGSATFDKLKHLTLFDQRDQGYLCFDPKKKGMEIVKSPTTERDVLNCFSSVKVAVVSLVGNTIGFRGSPVNFPGLNGAVGNTSFMSITDSQYFAGLIEPML